MVTYFWPKITLIYVQIGKAGLVNLAFSYSTKEQKDSKGREKPCTPSPGKAPCTPSPGKAPCTPSPGEAPCTPSPDETPCTPSPGETPCTPSPGEAPCTPSPGETPCTPSPGESPCTLSPGEAPCTPSSFLFWQSHLLTLKQLSYTKNDLQIFKCLSVMI